MSYQIALSALQAINSQLDTISQNIANTGTTGYKSSRTNFSAMYSSSAPNGVRASSTTQTLDMSGGLLSTGRNLDVAIAGKGYFMVKDSTGVMNYTRVGVFDVDKQGYVVDHMCRQVQQFLLTELTGVYGCGGKHATRQCSCLVEDHRRGLGQRLHIVAALDEDPFPSGDADGCRNGRSRRKCRRNHRLSW